MVNQTSEVQRLLDEGIAAARAGRKGQAQELLQRATRLDPRNEQAWLWLSGVEDTMAARTKALEQVLEINPENGAARRGLELLLQQQGLKPLPPRPASTAPAGPAMAPTDGAATTAPAAESEVKAPASESSALDDLRPMIAASQRRRGIRWSEVGILLLALIVFVLVMRVIFDTQFPEQEVVVDPYANVTPVRNQPRRPRASIRRGSPVPTQPARAAETPEPAILLTGGNFESEKYTLNITAASVDEQSVTLNVVLSNPGTSAARYRGLDFEMKDATGKTLTLDGRSSSVIQGSSTASQTIPARQQLSGVLVFIADEITLPLTINWRPTDGTPQTITLDAA